MNRRTYWVLMMVALVSSPTAFRMAWASVLVWDVDPAASYIRLTIPDQTIAVPDVGNITLRLRDAGSNSQWTDAGGRRAALDGEIVTDYVEDASIAFVGGSQSLCALETTALRPDPAQWDAAASNYTGTATAPAALGARIRGTYLFVTFDAAFTAFRAIRLDITNTTRIVVADGGFAANTTWCGIATAAADVDGLTLPLGLGQPVPDVRHGLLPPTMQQNAGGGTITKLGGLERKLTYTIHIPELSLDLEGMTVTGSAAGLIVAYAVIPDPSIPAPTLSARKQGDAIVLAWPTNATEFSLEYATDLPATHWSPAWPPPVGAKGENVVTNTITGGAALYRLHRP